MTVHLTASFGNGFSAHNAALLSLDDLRSPSQSHTALEDDISGEPPKERLHILLVEDEDLFRESLVSLVSNLQTNAVIDQTDTGSTAVEKATAQHFDLILMDVLLPDMGGDEACITMRARGVESRIVLMSAQEENRALADALNVEFLDKPLDDRELERILVECGGDAP